jgi:nucleotide-binding universal stress UspA family protein
MPTTDSNGIGTIVVGVDGSDSSVAALGWACDLAVRIGASVEAVTTIRPGMPRPCSPASSGRRRSGSRH